MGFDASKICRIGNALPQFLGKPRISGFQQPLNRSGVLSCGCNDVESFVPEVRSIAVLGATGSIGSSCLDIIRRHAGSLRAWGLSAFRSGDKLLNLVDERCGGRFEHVDAVIPPAERETFMAGYKKAAGLAIEALNAAPPTIAPGARVAG